ncbi:phosphoribosylaminoimidazolesuccinocarboxamide synthase [Candidatus Woesearchaeota archaeon]|nr:MAG: phosphoribosylaminoimidazolesuccinocarboxamide synthase [Candidatus Woesearchaeota archaeon]
MGSVKNFLIQEQPTPSKLGDGIMIFSDSYSVFDWGKMPDDIPLKGAALCVMGAFNFEMLGRERLPSHYIGIVSNGTRTTIDELAAPTNVMAVKVANVFRPKDKGCGNFDYSFFIEHKGKLNNFVVPLEVIYRNGAPAGSSLFRKIAELQEKSEDGNEELEALLGRFGLTEPPNPGDLFPKRGYDFTTKFEPKDRVLSDSDAYLISGLLRDDFAALESLRNDAATIIGEHGKRVGLIDYDGKLEFVFADMPVVADVFGTLDENRFFFNGEQVSKEFLRQWYKANDPEWVADVEQAKKRAEKESIADWKSLVSKQPRHLPDGLPELVGEMYAAAANLWIGRQLFKARPLDQVMEDIKPYRK